VPIGELAKTGLAQKLQATTKGGGLFRIELLSLASDPDFLCKAAKSYKALGKETFYIDLVPAALREGSPLFTSCREGVF
jgi:hypothetical protein